MKKTFWLLLLVGALSCDGMITGDTTPIKSDKHSQNNTTKTDNNANNTDNGELPPAFELEKQSLKLLPFHVRMRKLSAVVDLPTDDPLFSELWRNRYSLGDHNYGETIGPDLNWNASKMARWVESIQPLCASDAMATRYASFPESLNELWLNANGREITEDELAGISEIDTSNLDAAGRYEAYCLAALSSAEFVAQ